MPMAVDADSSIASRRRSNLPPDSAPAGGLLRYARNDEERRILPASCQQPDGWDKAGRWSGLQGDAALLSVIPQTSLRFRGNDVGNAGADWKNGDDNGNG